MNEYELSKLAEELDEDAIDIADYALDELLSESGNAEDFKEKYLCFYDDIKLTPHDDW